MLKASLIGFYNLRENTWETVEKLAKMGYRALENGEFLLNGDIAANLARLASLNMEVLSVSTDMAGLGDLTETIGKAKAIKVDKVCVYWSDPQTREEALTISSQLDQAGAQLRGEGLRLLYHNHSHEFKKSFDGVRYFDILMERTDPLNVGVNLDVGWATVGRMDVPALIRRLRKRIGLMHFKDFYDLDNTNSFTSLGTGKVDIQTLAGVADEIGVGYISVEQDTLRNLSMDETVLSSYLTLKESGFVL